MDLKKLYDTDLFAWTTKTSELLKSKQFDAVDWETVIEEIEALGRSEKRAIRSHLVILLTHMLKWEFQPEHQSRSWNLSIRNARKDLKRLLKENPSLKGDFLIQLLPDAYEDAREKASDETTIFLENFPAVCPYTLNEILGEN